MSIKENLIKETYDLDVIEMKNGIVDVSVPFDVVKSFLNSFFMKEGFLVVKGDNIDSRSYFKVLDDEIKLVIRVRDNIFIYEKLNLETLETEIELKELDGVMHIRNIEKLFKFRKDTIEYADAVLSHLCYANYLAHTQKQVVIESTTKQVITKKKKAKRKVQIRKINLTDIVRRVYSQGHRNDSEKRPYERYTESWTVRGHYRHYKSGKVTWIEASTRGSGKVQNKVYTVGGK